MATVKRGKALVAQLRAQAGVRDPEALAAYLGRYKKARRSGLAPEQAKKVAKGRSPQSPPKLQGNVNVSNPDHPQVRQHIADYKRIPVPILREVSRHGAKVYMGAKPMPELDDMQEFRGVQPRGWPEGSTWDSVPGAYHPASRAVIAGVGEHGSASVLLHEYGHAVGDWLRPGYTAVFREKHLKHYDKFTPYHQQGGPGGAAGVQEMIAESFACWSKGDTSKGRRSFGTAYDELTQMWDQLLKDYKDRQ